MIRRRLGLAALVAALLAGGAALARSAEEFRFREGRFEQGELRYRSGLPVLIVRGTPEQIGRQEAALTAKGAKGLLDYPRQMMRLFGQENRLGDLLRAAGRLLPQMPRDHLAELDAFAAQVGIDRDLLVGVNTMLDCYRGAFGCSSLLVEPQRSATGGPLFGRNLDFYTRAHLEKYSLVTVYRVQGKRAFASIGFPGMLGCFSGMNDAGLALATHEAFFSRDDAPMFNPKGMPYTFLLRRIMEECATVEEAVALLKSAERTTLFSVALADRKHCGVAEVTPENVVLRRSQEGLCACVNQFRSRTLATFRFSPRYNKLMQVRDLAQIRVEDVAKKLHEVNQGWMTLQTMIFEPASLRLHLAIGSCPSSALPLKRLDLAPLLGRQLPGKGQKDRIQEIGNRRQKRETCDRAIAAAP
jgi:isopenicillin-N N-acyltransferase-like protein